MEIAEEYDAVAVERCGQVLTYELLLVHLGLVIANGEAIDSNEQRDERQAETYEVSPVLSFVQQLTEQESDDTAYGEHGQGSDNNTQQEQIEVQDIHLRWGKIASSRQAQGIDRHEGGGYPYQGFPQYLMMLAPIQVMTVNVNHGEGDEKDQGDEDSGDHIF